MEALHPAFFLLPPPSFILPPSSFILPIVHLDDYHNMPISPHEVLGSRPVVGVCPTCERVSDSLRIGVQTWHFCDPCQTAWHTSSSRIGDETTEADWSANRKKLDRYRIVPPAPSSLTRLIHETMIARGQMTRR